MAENREINQPELILQALKATQELRTSVTQVFDKLSNGISKSRNSSKSASEDFVGELQKNLRAINNDLGDIESANNALQSNNQVQLGNSALLTMDPQIDKTPLHTQVVTCYKWANKLQQYAHWSTSGAKGIPANSIKRSIGAASASKRRKIPTGQVPPQYVESLINPITRARPDMRITITRPFGSPCVLQVELERTLQAVVVLRGVLIEWVQVKALHEEFTKDDGKMDIWSKSRYKVFQKVSENAMAGVLHFFLPQRQEVALHSFIQWLYSFIKLFSTPCVACGRVLVDNLPPTWRDFSSGKAYHDPCK